MISSYRHNTEKVANHRTSRARLSQHRTQREGQFATWLATGFGIGRVPLAPGTFGTLLGIPLFLALRELSSPVYVAVVLLLFASGAWICHVAERQLGVHDHKSIVLDEVVGYLITLWLAPPGWIWLAIGFGLFRIFDIWKPFPIRRLEQLPGGLGVMADDAMAGVYGLGALQAIFWLSRLDLI
jgi:phosphatidylglycerophosphatase A